MKLVGGVREMQRHPELYPELIEHIGRYVTRYEPELAPFGQQWIWTTDDPEKALQLPSSEMFRLYRKSIGTRPLDGKPDRPISIYEVEIA